MKKDKPIIEIKITGDSAIGKTTLAKKILESFDNSEKYKIVILESTPNGYIKIK